MPKISICTCNVAIGGDIGTVVARGEHRPVTWPEIDVLMHLHGEDAVTDIVVIDTKETSIPEEFERLTLRYGTEATATLFPGKRPAMQLEAPADVPRAPKPAKASKAATAEIDPFKE